MTEKAEIISKLLEKIEELMKRQASFQRELSDLYSEVENLKIQDAEYGIFPPKENKLTDEVKEKPEFFTANRVEPAQGLPLQKPDGSNPPEPVPVIKPKVKTDLEKFIGENLINKIGIAVTIIGVGIGAKYAIDHQLISPWTRIILGYLVGMGLFGFAFRLSKQYRNFSAVLLSGSMAIMYFITYAAYTFYDLIPLIVTFMLMVLFTVFTVAAAIKYDRQVISIIGLVGAYAVPFLLSDGTGKVLILYSYMTMINIGVLVIAFKKYWKVLCFSSFLLTWIIFFTWYITSYQAIDHFLLALVFVTVFFATFYLMILAYKLIRNEKFELENILILLVNSGIFFGLGYATLNSDAAGEEFTGLFTLGNAMIHFAAALLIWFRKPADPGLFSYILGLGLVFVTITIPVQLNGQWVTLLWAGEAGVLFWIGRTKNLIVYELLSYPLMFLVFFSIIHDWSTVYNGYDPQQPGTKIFPILNINFLTSMFFVLSFGFIQYFSVQPKYISPLVGAKPLLKVMNFSIPAILLFVLFFAFIKEISTFWNQLYTDSLVTKNQDLTVPQHFQNDDLLKYGSITVINYSLLFFSLLSFVNIRWVKNTILGLFNLGLNTIILGIFLTVGLYTLGELRESYISQALSELFYRGWFNIGIRYISFAFAGLILFSVYKYVWQEFIQVNFKMEFDILLHITLLTLLSNELINWMDIYEPGQSYKLGLSILFGIYALLLVALGIWKRKTHLRIAAMVLFASTLLKLFFYDLTDLDTISKTIVFVILGILLLIISFLYNKYKGLIFNDLSEKQEL